MRVGVVARGHLDSRMARCDNALVLPTVIEAGLIQCMIIQLTRSPLRSIRRLGALTSISGVVILGFSLPSSLPGQATDTPAVQNTNFTVDPPAVVSFEGTGGIGGDEDSTNSLHALEQINAELKQIQHSVNAINQGMATRPDTTPLLRTIDQSLTNLQQRMNAQALDLPTETKLQIQELHAMVSATQAAVKSRFTPDVDLFEIYEKLNDIQEDIEPSLFDDIWRSYVSSTVWEFFGIKRGSGSEPNLVGRFVSLLGALLGIVLIILKIRYWNRNQSPEADSSKPPKLLEFAWSSYALILAVAFCLLTWIAAKVEIPAEAIRMHEEIGRVTSQVETLGNLSALLGSLDERLADLKEQPVQSSENLQAILNAIKSDVQLLKAQTNGVNLEIVENKLAQSIEDVGQSLRAIMSDTELIRLQTDNSKSAFADILGWILKLIILFVVVAAGVTTGILAHRPVERLFKDR